MKFKVGDKVRIVKTLEGYYINLIGKEFLVGELDETKFPYLWAERGIWWCDEELELVEKGVNKMKINEIFEKNDINARYYFEGSIWRIEDNYNDLIDNNLHFITHCYPLRDILEAEFTEIERKIDWTKVPKGTMIKVRDYDEDIWDEKEFVDCMNDREGLNFLIKEKGRWVCYDCATIDNPKEEWYK